MPKPKNKHAVELGKLAGAKRKKQLGQLSKTERSELGRKAANARWNRRHFGNYSGNDYEHPIVPTY